MFSMSFKKVNGLDYHIESEKKKETKKLVELDPPSINRPNRIRIHFHAILIYMSMVDRFRSAPHLKLIKP